MRAHLKTHEAEYQNSATSLALYRRALAALGSSPETTHSSSSPIAEEQPESPEELIDEDNEEDIDEKESTPSPKMPLDYPNARLTVTV